MPTNINGIFLLKLVFCHINIPSVSSVTKLRWWNTTRTGIFIDGWNTTTTGFFFDEWKTKRRTGFFSFLARNALYPLDLSNINQSQQKHGQKRRPLLVLLVILLQWRKQRDQVACVWVCRVQRCKKKTITIFYFFLFVSQGSFFLFTS